MTSLQFLAALLIAAAPLGSGVRANDAQPVQPTPSNVAPNGTFTTSIPIDIPQGINGIAPNLAFSFSSVNGNGLLGTGWALAGLATISRVSDGKGIRYDGRDRYISPHGRLFKQPNADYYLAENHNLVRYYPTGVCGDGPCSWRVQHPDGSTQLFGQTEDARILARLVDRPAMAQKKPAAFQPGSVRLWAVNKQQDRFGNAYLVTYRQYPTTGDYYPDQISYTHTRSKEAHKTISFGYGEQPGDAPLMRPDNWAKYQQNALVHQRFLLRWVNVTVGGKLLKRYKLTYDVSEFSRLSRLRQISIIGSDDVTASVPYKFDWQDQPLKVAFDRLTNLPGLAEAKFDPNIAEIHTGDFNGDGKADFLKTDVVQNFWLLAGKDREGFDYKQIKGRNYEQGATLIIGDYDGDGISDMLKMHGTKPHFVGYGNASGEFDYKEPFDAIRYNGVDGLAAGDFNGDGRMDIFKFCGQGEPTWIAYGQSDRSFVMKDDVLPNGCSLWDEGAKVFNGDYNMDGRSDLLVISPRGEHFALYSTAEGFDVVTTVPGLENLAYDPAADQLEVGDFNGDGIADLINLSSQGDHWLIMARGDGSFSRPQSLGGLSSKVLAKDTASVLVGDINGDNLADLFQLDSRGEYTWGVIASGDGSFSDIPITGLSGKFDADWQVRIGDVTGTNSADFVFFLPGGGSELAHSPTKVQDALVGITTPKGQRTAISYQHAAKFKGLIKPGSDDCAVGFGDIAVKRMAEQPVGKAYGRDVCGVADSSVRYLVRQVSVSGGSSGGALRAAGSQDQSQSYSYENARYFPGTISEYAQLGFERLVQVDDNTGMKTVTTFHQNKPYQGHPARIQKFAGNGALRYQEDMSYQLLRPISGLSEVQAVKLIRKVTTTYEGKGKTLAVSALVESHEFGYDPLGFMTTDKVCTGRGSGVSCKVMTREYSQDFAAGLQGQLLSQKVMNSAGQVQNWQRYSYRDGQLHKAERLLCEDASACDESSGVWQASREVLAVNSSGLVTKERNIRGDVITRDYSDQGQLTAETNSLGLSKRTRYDDLGRVSAEVDLNGNATTLRHDALGRIVEVVKPSGARLVTEFFDEGNPVKQRRVETSYAGSKALMVKEHYIDGHDFTYKTSEWGLAPVRAGAGADNIVVQLKKRYWQDGQRYEATSAKHYEGETPLYDTKVFDRYDRLVKEISKDGITTTTAYSPAGLTVTTPKGTTTVEVNGFGKVTKRTFADGRWLSYSYDANQHLVSVATSTGKVTSFSRNNLGWKTAMTDPTVGTLRYAYSPAGDVLKETSAATGLANGNNGSGVATTRASGKNGRVRGVAAIPLRGASSGAVTAPDTPMSGVIDNAIDGRSVVTGRASGKNGRVRGVAANSSADVTTVYEYDVLGRITSKTVGDEPPLTYEYDGATANGQGRLTKVSGAFGWRQLSYTPAGKVTVTAQRYENMAATYTETRRYDELGRVVSHAFPDGTVQRFSYDALGRTRSITVDDQLLADYDGYDAVGRTGTKTVWNGFRQGTEAQTVDRFSYDPARDTIANLKTLAADGAELQHIRYGYNKAAELAQITDLRANTTVPGADGQMVDTSVSQSFGYDAMGQLTKATGNYGSKAFAYDQDGNITRRQGKQFDELRYNGKNQITSNDALQTAYDSRGNMTLKQTAKAKWQYKYNGSNRLVTVQKNGELIAEYAYDDKGRRYKKTINSKDGSTTTWYVSRNVELTTFGSKSGTILRRHYYGIDDQRVATETLRSPAAVTALLTPDYGEWAGALTLGSVAGAWQKAGLYAQQAGLWLRHAFTPTAALAGLGGLFVLLFLWSAWQQTRNGLGRLAAHTALGYVVAAAGLMTTPAFASQQEQRRAAGEQVFYHYDYLGSATVLTGSDGQAIKRYVYTPYGEMESARSVGAGSSGIRFGGYQADDETGLLYVNARYYDPSLGRFLTPDPTVPKNGEDFLGLNRYAYVKNNPIAYTDPTGLSWISALWKRATRAASRFIKKGVATIKNAVAEASKTFTVLAAKIIDQGKKFLSRHKKQIFAWAVKTATAAVHAAVTSFAGPVAGSMVAGLFSGFVTGAGLTLMNGGSFAEAMKVGIQQAIKSLPEGIMASAITAPLASTVSGVVNTVKSSPPGELIKLLKSGVDTAIKVASDYAKGLFTAVGEAVKELSFIKELDASTTAPGLGSKLVNQGVKWLTGAARTGLGQVQQWLHQQIDKLFAVGEEAFAPPRRLLTTVSPPGG